MCLFCISTWLGGNYVNNLFIKFPIIHYVNLTSLYEPNEVFYDLRPPYFEKLLTIVHWYMNNETKWGFKVYFAPFPIHPVYTRTVPRFELQLIYRHTISYYKHVVIALIWVICKQYLSIIDLNTETFQQGVVILRLTFRKKYALSKCIRLRSIS